MLALEACSDNLFGSNSPSGGNDVKSLRIDADNAFRKGNFEGSYNICKRIVEIDPSSSFGYFGMARAGLWWHGVNPLSMPSLVRTEENECPFMGKNVTVKRRNDYFQAMKKIVPALSELDRRDSLTVLYEFHMRAKENKGWDTTFTVTITIDGKDETSYVNLDERLADFRKTFCGGLSSNDCSDTTLTGQQFPLSDREYKRSYFGNILLLSTFSRWFLGFYDVNSDSCLTRKQEHPKSNSEWEEWGCKKGSDGEFSYDSPVLLICSKDKTGKMSVVIDSKQMMDDLQNELGDYYTDLDACIKKCNGAEIEACTKSCNNQIKIPDEIKNINESINNFGDDFKEVEDMLNSLGLTGSSDDPEADKNLRDELEKYKAYSAFYKMGTHIDEDGDGCIDEDLLDGQDNDGDGLVNANARVASTDPTSPLWGMNSINNSMWGNSPYRNNENWEYNKPDTLRPPVKIYNDPDHSTYTLLPGDSITGLVTVIKFTQDPKYWTTRDLDLKLEVAQDTTCPPKYDLEYRKQKIGGCWPNYDENKFVAYWLKRELANNPNRVHPSCKGCTGENCLK